MCTKRRIGETVNSGDVTLPSESGIHNLGSDTMIGNVQWQAGGFRGSKISYWQIKKNIGKNIGQYQCFINFLSFPELAASIRIVIFYSYVSCLWTMHVNFSLLLSGPSWINCIISDASNSSYANTTFWNEDGSWTPGIYIISQFRRT
jgi:hypothetical protein